MSNPITQVSTPSRSNALSKHAPLQPVASVIPPSPAEIDIDDTLEQSFPASDPPAWTLGRNPCAPTRS